MKGFLDNLAGLGLRRLLLIAGGGLGIVAALWLGLGMALAPTWRPVVVDATASSAALMVAELEKSGFAPRVSPDGTMISLPEEDIARARMALAEAGLPPSGTTGWELFDDPSIIGMNSGLQRVNRLRALEGELARSIETIDIVDMARVHLVLPERETFSEDRPEASASIIIRTRPGQILERRQALAVRSLVAAAVPELSPERVTVLSSTGEAILSEEDAGDGVSEAQAQIEDRLRRNIESILGAYVGAENVRVRVAAQLDPSQQVVVEQSFNPDQQVPRSVTTSTDKSQSQDRDSAAVDVANNLPAVTSGPGGGGSTANSDSQSQETQYEIGSTRSETVTAAGAIKRLSVAVLVNGVWDGSTYTERTQEELDKLGALVRSAAGVDDGRGDTVTVESLRFAEGAEALDGGAGRGWSDLLASQLGTILRALGGFGIVAMVVLFAVRPILRHLSKGSASSEPLEALPALDGEAPMMMSLAGPMAAPAAPLAGGGGLPALEAGPGEVLSFASFAGGVTRHYVDDFSRLVETEPEASMRTIRAWINQKG